MQNKNTIRFALTISLLMFNSHHMFCMQGINDQDAQGNTQLHRAAENDQIDIVQRLIAAGANLNLQNNSGSTPLHLAVEKNQINIVEALIIAGANLNLRDSYGCAPLRQSIWYSQISVTQALIAAGADLNIQDTNGCTPLHFAVENNHIKMVQALIAAGADTYRLNNRGRNIHQRLCDASFQDRYGRTVYICAQNPNMTRAITVSITQREVQQEVRRENERIRNAHRVEIVMRGKPQLPAELRNDILKFL